ncbi:hypothetical protein [Actinospongicola halichondriae]|uniref:hypothetical protein n=1 Tax=Actinospongicola halichondriae TaxID=3236844 RepID=UPI003D3A7427
MSIRRTTVAAAASLLLVFAACGDDDDTTTVETPVGDIDTDALADAENIGDVLDATGLETKASAMKTAMGFDEYEMVDDKTVKIFVEGSADDGGIMDCMIANGVVDDDETVIAVYPDGEVNCRD